MEMRLGDRQSRLGGLFISTMGCLSYTSCRGLPIPTWQRQHDHGATPIDWDCGAPQMTYLMFLALAPLIAAVGIAIVWDRWTTGSG